MLLRRLMITVLLLLPTFLYAVDLEVTQGINSALPIAIGSFGYDEVGQRLSEIINGDLRFSGQFKILPAIEKSGLVSVNACRQAGADSVLTGRVTKIGYNRYNVNYELIDAVAQGKVLFSKNYQISANDARGLAHHISDEVYEKLLGERGIFSTKIGYILVQHLGGKDRYSLEVADVDGQNPQSLLVSSEPIMSPAWSPDGSQIAYVSFEKKKAQIFTVSVATGKRRLLTDFAGINGAPAWSPNGREMAVVLSKGGAPKIYRIDLNSGDMKQLTFGEAIDTEPRYSPDGQSILFTSGRGGSPQIYRLSLRDGAIARLTYVGNYNARASYTPSQKHIVMLHRENKTFNIGVQEMSTSQVTQLTFSAFDESPTIAPNGRFVLYATRKNNKGVLAMVSLDGHSNMQMPTRNGDVQEPTWSPFLG